MQLLRRGGNGVCSISRTKPFETEKRGQSMENFITMLNTQMILLIYLLVGVYARKRRIITPQ